MDAFGIINMNGRVYDPLTAQFFSPDPVLQAPGDWLNYNRYGYCMGNPFRYTDPSGNSWMSNIFSAVAGIGVTLSVGIATAGLGFVAAAIIGGASSGLLSGTLGTALNGGSFGESALAGVKGVISGGITGAVGGVLAPIGGAGMSFAENLLLGTAEGAITGGVGAALSGGDIGKGILWGAAAGAVFTTIFSENMSNELRGKGFKTNENVFKDFAAYKYPSNGQVWQQNALDYFGFKGKYDPTNPLFKSSTGAAVTDPKTGNIFYNVASFNRGYQILKYNADHEFIHQTHVLTGKAPRNVITKEMYDYEEFLTYKETYSNGGLYNGLHLDGAKGNGILQRLNQHLWNLQTIPKYYNLQFQPSKVLDFLYSIPRRF